MPQWDFLDFRGAREEAADVPFADAGGGDWPDRRARRVTGVRATTPDGELEIWAGARRRSRWAAFTVRDKAGLKRDDHGAPIDVLWLRLPHQGGRS